MPQLTWRLTPKPSPAFIPWLTSLKEMGQKNPRSPRRRAGNISLKVTKFSDGDLQNFRTKENILAVLMHSQLSQPPFLPPETTGMSILSTHIFQGPGRSPKSPCHPSLPARGCCPWIGTGNRAHAWRLGDLAAALHRRDNGSQLVSPSDLLKTTALFRNHVLKSCDL